VKGGFNGGGGGMGRADEGQRIRLKFDAVGSHFLRFLPLSLALQRRFYFNSYNFWRIEEGGGGDNLAR